VVVNIAATGVVSKHLCRRCLTVDSLSWRNIAVQYLLFIGW